jgi:hypothetical protein
MSGVRRVCLLRNGERHPDKPKDSIAARDCLGGQQTGAAGPQRKQVCHVESGVEDVQRRAGSDPTGKNDLQPASSAEAELIWLIGG